MPDITFEAMLKEAVTANFQAKMDALPSKEETLREYQFSAKHTRRMKKLFAMERRTPFARQIHSFAKAAALVLCVAAVLFASVLAVSPQIRAAVWEAIVRVFDRHTEIEFREPEGSPIREARDFSPRHIPQGYMLTHEEFFEPHGESYTAIYKNADGDMLVFGVDPPGQVSVDNEYLVYYTEIHAGVTYHIHESHDGERESVIIWSMDGFAYSLYGLVPVDELMTVAQSVE